MYQSSAGVFISFLGNLSSLLDRAATDAAARKIDPSVLLNARLYPNMYNLTRQVGEAIRHAVLACSLLAGIDPPAFSESEPDIPELKVRIAIAVDFMRSLVRRDRRRRGQGCSFHVPKWIDARIQRSFAAVDV
jgi:hypothetical protein